MIAAAALCAGAACTRPPSTPPPQPRHSLIVITVDTLRADHVDATRMPALARLQEQAVTFEQAISPGSVTLPTHASLLTGLYPTRHGVRDNNLYALAPGVPVFTDALRRRGYATAAFVSAIVLDARYGLARGFDIYDGVEEPRIEREAPSTLARARSWIEQAREPFFLWIHLFDPHAPYRSGSYAAEVALVDREIGAFVDYLRERGLWDRVVLSVTADHGESLGEHGELTHGFFIYDATIRIPWVLRAPGLRAGRVAQQVRLVDVLPTMADLAGQGEIVAREGELHDIDGVSLVPLIEGRQQLRLEAYAETFLPRHQFGWSELKAVRTERAKFIEAPRPEFYDLREDPAERRNLAEGRRTDVAEARRTLAAIESAARTASRVRTTDPLLAERFMSLGYLGYSPGTAGLPATSSGLADPKDKLAIYLQAMEAIDLASRGERAAALAVLDRLLAADPAVAQAHFLRATLLGDAGRFREAVAALERALALNPRHVTARFRLALALLRLGEADRAQRELETVLRDEPTNVRAWHNLAAIAYSRGDLARAETLERRALEIDPEYAEAWNTLGAVFLMTDRPREATDALERATRLAPRNGQAFANLALALDRLGRAREAQAARDRACSLDARHCES